MMNNTTDLSVVQLHCSLSAAGSSFGIEAWRNIMGM
jgi:hypothetical protein